MPLASVFGARWKLHEVITPLEFTPTRHTCWKRCRIKQPSVVQCPHSPTSAIQAQLPACLTYSSLLFVSLSCTIILSNVMQGPVFPEWAACVNTDKWPASSPVEPVSRWCQSSIPIVTRGSAS